MKFNFVNDTAYTLDRTTDYTGGLISVCPGYKVR